MEFVTLLEFTAIVFRHVGARLGIICRSRKFERGHGC